jgi:tetratricopeptide (TPR) repeat protein
MNVQVWTGAETQALREALRMSQDKFAEKARVSLGAVKKWEFRGADIRLSPQVAKLLDGMLERAAPNDIARFQRILAESAANSGYSAPVGADPLQDAADESSELLSWIEGNNVGPLTIEDMRGDLQAISRAYLRAPTLPLFTRTLAIRDRAVELLRGRQRPNLASQLYDIAGWATVIVGWITVDLGRPETADKHLRAAWALAEEADDDDLRAWVRASQHTAAFWREDYTKAARYADDGLQYARTGTAELFLASAHALDLARSGDRRAAIAAVDRAVDVGAQLESEPQVDEFGGPFSCSVERAGGFWADTCLALPDPKRSLAYAMEAVSVYSDSPEASRNLGSERMVRCQQIKAHVALGDLDVAIGQLAQISATPPEHRVEPLIQRVEEIAWMARNVAGEGRGVVEIEKCAADFRRGSEIGALPALT